jgi:hypothetical protein
MISPGDWRKKPELLIFSNIQEGLFASIGSLGTKEEGEKTKQEKR